MVDVDVNITLYADLIWLLFFKTETVLSNSQLVLWLTPVGTVLCHIDLTIHIYTLNILSTTDILQNKVLLTPILS